MRNYLVRFTEDEEPAARLRIVMMLIQLDRMCFFLGRDALPAGRDALIDALEAQWWAVLQERS